MKSKALASLWQFAYELMEKLMEQRSDLETFCETMAAAQTGDFGVTTIPVETRDATLKAFNETWSELQQQLYVYPAKWMKRNVWMMETIVTLGLWGSDPPPPSSAGTFPDSTMTGFVLPGSLPAFPSSSPGTFPDPTMTGFDPSGSVPPSEMFPGSMPGGGPSS